MSEDVNNHVNKKGTPGVGFLFVDRMVNSYYSQFDYI